MLYLSVCLSVQIYLSMLLLLITGFILVALPASDGDGAIVGPLPQQQQE